MREIFKRENKGIVCVIVIPFHLSFMLRLSLFNLSHPSFFDGLRHARLLKSPVIFTYMHGVLWGVVGYCYFVFLLCSAYVILLIRHLTRHRPG